MKKIMFLSAANSIHTVKWVNSLSKKYEIHLVYCSNHKPNMDNIANNVILHELKFNAPMGYYLNKFELKRLFENIKPDLVNVHYASGYGTLARMSKLKPVLLSVWGSDVYDFPYESNFKKKVLTKNILYAQKIASTSKVMAKQVYKVVENLKEKIYITPFGVDTDKFKNNGKRNNKKIIIGNVKTLDVKYGIDYLILGVSELLKIRKKNGEETRNIELHIYGDGNQRNELEKIVKEENLERVVFFKGKIPNDDVPNVLNKMDIFCATSVISSESFGVAVVEAMACELPVIATNVDGFSEVMVNNKTGILINKKDYLTIANALEELINDKNKRIYCGKEGRKRVLKNYNWNDNVKTMEKIYEEMIKEG